MLALARPLLSSANFTTDAPAVKGMACVAYLSRKHHHLLWLVAPIRPEFRITMALQLRLVACGPRNVA